MLRDTEHTSTTSTMTKRTRSAAKALSGANQDAAASCSPVHDARRASKAAPDGAAKRGRNGPLGILAKSVDQIDAENRKKASKRRAFRLERYVLQRQAARLVPAERVSKCRWTFQSNARGVDVMRAGGSAFYQGLQTCGSPWLCPVCSSKISEVRRSELNDALAWARAVGVIPVMLTLTHRHGAGDVLAENLDGMKAAKRRLRQRREWRAIKPMLAGTVSATEVTHGAAGWHVHFHEIAFVQAETEAEAVALFSDMGRVWVAALHGCGLDGTLPHAWQVQGAAAAGEYLGKWGAAEELALADRKQGKRAGLTPWQLLAASRDGDAVASAKWVEYAKAFKGARQLVWSPGLKAAVGVAEVDDTAAAADEVAEPERLVNINRESWLGDAVRLGARHRRARILDAAETGGAAGVAAVVADGSRDDTPEPADAVLDDEPEHPVVGGGDDFEKVGHPETFLIGDCPKGNTVQASAHMHAPDLKKSKAEHIPQPGDTRRPSAGFMASGNDSGGSIMKDFKEMARRLKSPGEDEHGDFVDAFLTAYEKEGLFRHTEGEEQGYMSEAHMAAQGVKNLAIALVADMEPEERIRQILYALKSEREIADKIARGREVF